MTTAQEYFEDKGRAAIALLDWARSQDIKITDSVPVLAIAMASMIHSIAKEHNEPVEKVLGEAIELIEAVVENMEGHDEPE
jgi:hypothetical protein